MYLTESFNNVNKRWHFNRASSWVGRRQFLAQNIGSFNLIEYWELWFDLMLNTTEVPKRLELNNQKRMRIRMKISLTQLLLGVDPIGFSYLLTYWQIYYWVQSNQINTRKVVSLTQLLLGVDPVGSPYLLHSVFGLCTQPALSFLMQQAVSRSFSRSSRISRSSTSSHRMQGAYFAPRCIRFDWKGTKQNWLGWSKSLNFKV